QSSLGLQMKVADALERNFDAVQQVKDVRRGLTEHTRRSAADPVARAAKGLDEKTTLLLGEPGSPSIPSEAVTLMTLNESLISLMALLDGADSEPSDASLVAFQRMSDQLSANLSAWQELKAKELKALNAVLAEHKLAVLPAYSNLNGAQDERK